MLFFVAPTYLVVHAAPTSDDFSFFVAWHHLVSQMKAQSHYLSLHTSILFIFILATSVSYVVFLVALLSNILCLFCVCCFLWWVGWSVRRIFVSVWFLRELCAPVDEKCMCAKIWNSPPYCSEYLYVFFIFLVNSMFIFPTRCFSFTLLCFSSRLHTHSPCLEQLAQRM